MADVINFDIYHAGLLEAARQNYEAHLTGREPNAEAIREAILPELSNNEQRNMVEAELIVAARTIGRLAVLEDQIEARGFTGLLARLEVRLSVALGESFARPALESGGIIDTIRGVTYEEPAPISLFQSPREETARLTEVATATKMA